MAISESTQSKAIMGSPPAAPESLHHPSALDLDLALRLRLLPPSTTVSSSKFLQHDSAALLVPILSSCYLKPRPSGCGTRASVSPPMMRVRALFSTGPSSSSSSSSSSSPSPEVQNYKLPPPANPPDPENPDRATLRAQWDHAVRLYGRMYSHAWGTAILAGVSLFGIGWWIKGENPLKALSPTGELNKKEETAD